jgi:hypothetical protein
MTKRTRFFLTGAVAFLVVGLSVGVMAYYNGGLPVLKGGAGPAELQYVPDTAVVVAYANVRQVMASEFRQRMKAFEAGKGEKGQQEFKDETGIDIEKDIDSVVAFMTPEAGGPDKGGAVIATGRFDETKIVNLVREKGGTVGDHKGKRLLTFTTKSGSKDAGGAIGFLAGNVVVVGSLETVRRTLDGPANDVTGNAKMMDLIRGVDRGNAWVVGKFDALSSQAKLPEQVMSQIPPISWFSASGQIDGGLSGTLSVETADAAAAENLRKVAEGLMGLAGLQMKSGSGASQFQQVLNSFQLRQDDKTLTLTFSLPSDLIFGLANQAMPHPKKDGKQ